MRHKLVSIPSVYCLPSIPCGSQFQGVRQELYSQKLSVPFTCYESEAKVILAVFDSPID